VKSKKSKQQFASYLRKSLNAHPNLPKVRDVRYHRSSSDNLIQAADMVSGAVYAKYHRGNSEYIDYIRAKISDEWIWRPKTWRGPTLSGTYVRNATLRAAIRVGPHGIYSCSGRLSVREQLSHIG
jgi:hypothetical protein